MTLFLGIIQPMDDRAFYHTHLSHVLSPNLIIYYSLS
jgi:hypothetical protein